MSSNSKECNVCIEKYTNAVHKKKIQCNYCEYNCCVSCAQTYLLSQVSDAHCMNCRTGWNREFIDLNMTKTFRTKEWREHKKIMILNREKALLPTMQRYAAAKKLIEELKIKQAEHSINYLKICSEHAAIYKEVSVIKTQISSANTSEEIEIERYKKLTVKLKEAHEKDDEYVRSDIIQNKLINMYFIQLAIYNNSTNVEKEKKEFILKCVKEGCRGFLSTAYKCELCATYVCRDCMIAKKEKDDTTHVCKKEDIDTVVMIRKDTKPCPKCGIRISKIDGCNQMFCVAEDCHTAFDWVTGKIVSGVIHNPHYYEWVRRNNNGAVPRNPNDNPCNERINYYQLYNVLQANVINLPKNVSRVPINYFSNIHRLLTDIEAFRLLSYPQTRDVNMFKEVHCDFLLNRIDEASWKQSMFLKENSFEKKQQIGMILITFVTLMNDLFRKFYEELLLNQHNSLANSSNITSLFDKYKNEFEEIRKYINESLVTIGKMILCAVPQFGSDKTVWYWQSIKKVEKILEIEKMTT